MTKSACSIYLPFESYLSFLGLLACGITPLIYQPNCGEDGKNYGNLYNTKCAGVKVKCWGRCPCKGKHENSWLFAVKMKDIAYWYTHSHLKGQRIYN